MSNRRRVVPGVHPYDGPAGGWGALKATAIAVRTQMDALDAPATLLRTNQPDGFDCPRCARPDKEHKSTFQFCENGAKAVTWEATSKRVTAEFLAANTVTSLLARSDFELEGYGRLTQPWPTIRPAIPCVRSHGTRRLPESAPFFVRCSPMKSSFIPPGAPLTKWPSCSSCLPANMAPTTFRTAPICATSRPASACRSPSASVKGRSPR